MVSELALSLFFIMIMMSSLDEDPRISSFDSARLLSHACIIGILLLCMTVLHRH